VLIRLLASWPGVSSVIGVDRAPARLETARALAAPLPNTSFRQADGGSLPFEDATFDVVVFDAVPSHIENPEQALAEAFRVLRPLGQLAAFDGDYATTTVALGDHDPLQTCVEAMIASAVHDRWVVRRLPALVRRCGFELVGFHSHGFADASGGDYMRTVVEPLRSS
jgi:ubiquinone/menaquinone biosynthesis C-methylase UbiE